MYVCIGIGRRIAICCTLYLVPCEQAAVNTVRVPELVCVQTPAAVNYNIYCSEAGLITQVGRPVQKKKGASHQPDQQTGQSLLRHTPALSHFHTFTLPTRIRILKHPYLPGLGRGGRRSRKTLCKNEPNNGSTQPLK